MHGMKQPVGEEEWDDRSVGRLESNRGHRDVLLLMRALHWKAAIGWHSYPSSPARSPVRAGLTRNVTDGKCRRGKVRERGCMMAFFASGVCTTWVLDMS